MATTVETLAGPPAQLSEDRLEELRAQLRGGAFGAGEPGSADSHPPFNAMYPDEAAITVRCSGTADVVDAIAFARSHGLSVAVRGGGHSIAGLSSSRGGMLIDLGAMRGVVVDPERRLAYVQGGALLGRRRPRDPALRPGHARRRGLRHRGRGPHARRRLRLVAAQVRPVQRQRRRRAGRPGRRPRRHRLRGPERRPVLGAAGRRRQLRHRHRVHVPPAPGGPGGRLLGDLLPARGARLDPARLPRRHGAVPRRGDGDRRHDDVPRQPGAARGDPRPAGGHRRRRPRRRRGRGPGDDRAAARARHAAVRHVGADAVRRRADRLRRAVPAPGDPRLLEVAVRRGAVRPAHRRPRRPRPRAAGAADPAQHVPHGRGHRRRRPGGHGVRRPHVAVHDLDRRQLARRRPDHPRQGVGPRDVRRGLAASGPAACT